MYYIYYYYICAYKIVNESHNTNKWRILYSIYIHSFHSISVLLHQKSIGDSVISGRHTWSSLSHAEHFISLTTVIDSGAVGNWNWLIQSDSKTFARNSETKTILFLLNVNRKHFPLTLPVSILRKQSI